MSAPLRKPLLYTFGNHMHWVDFQWLWGYRALPDCIDDTIALCHAVGVKGNVNFDAVGYEKLAADAPAALARLRAAVQQGQLEIVGASYGQPYGLFCGGESNCRQLTFGARAVRRLLGVWPASFWEEEFDFFPQLPQLLRGCGFTGASLFFQWTWHTPSVPEETVPLVQWEGIDGSRLPTLCKTALCLHQWPEDFDGRLDLAAAAERPAVVQWLELLPSPDWMCRSEVLLPRLRELVADARFAVRPGTLAEVIEALDDGQAPVRRYTMDDVFHGMSIGKNADFVPRRGDLVEARILTAEALAANLGLLGRPYASWDVWPEWEIDEAWRELLAAQHHDNHECERLCGSVGKASFDRAATLATDVLLRCWRHAAGPAAADGGDALVVFNALGWPRDVLVRGSRAQEAWGEHGPGRLARAVPPFGWALIARDDAGSRVASRVTAVEQRGAVVLRAGDLEAVVDRATGRVRVGPAGAQVVAGGLCMRRDGEPYAFGVPALRVVEQSGEPGVLVEYRGELHAVRQWIRLRPEHGGVELGTSVDRLPRPDGGYQAALRLPIDVAQPFTLFADTPFAVDAIAAAGRYERKYPSGDWMTSPQWFETVTGPFTARSLVDLVCGEAGGVLCIHDGSQGWARTAKGVENVLNAYDPWDEDYWQETSWSELVLVPHGPGLGHAERMRRAAEVRALSHDESVVAAGRRWPERFGGPAVEPGNVLITAFGRESRQPLEHVAGAFGAAADRAQEVRNPYFVRLVEFDGRAAEVVLRVPGPCPLAARTNLLGAVVEELRAEPCDPPPFALPGMPWCALRLCMRPREVATVMLDLAPGRHQGRNLDEHRSVWATVHRRES